MATWLTVGTEIIYIKLLSESVNTTREDFFPDTTETWVGQDRAEGIFKTAGSFDILVEPNIFPKLMTFFIGDPVSSTPISDSGYTHTWKFGNKETVATTGIKPFTIWVGTGAAVDGAGTDDVDRQMASNVFESMSLEYSGRDLVSLTMGVLGSGKEAMVEDKTPVYTVDYTGQPYFTFADCSLFQINGVSRLADPMVEAFSLNLNRGYDADHFRLGSRFWAYPSLSGMASVGGSIDLSFTSTDEHEHFLSALGAAATAGDQTPFALQCKLEGALYGVTDKYTIDVTVPKVSFTASTPSVSGRDRVVQKLDWRGMNDGTDSACTIVVKNIKEAYTGNLALGA